MASRISFSGRLARAPSIALAPLHRAANWHQRIVPAGIEAAKYQRQRSLKYAIEPLARWLEMELAYRYYTIAHANAYPH